MLARRIGRDIVSTLAAFKVAAILFVAYAAMSGVSFALSVSAEGLGGFSLADALAWFVRGMEEYDPASGLPFLPDARWMAPFLVIAYAACSSLHFDRGRRAPQVVVRIGGRVPWAATRLASVLVLCACAVGTVVACALAVWLVAGHEGAAGVTVAGEAATGLPLRSLAPGQLWGRLALAAYVLVAFGALALAVSAFAGPVWSFAAMVVMTVASAYANHPVLFPGFAMLARSDGIVEGGLATGPGVAACTLVVAASAAALLLKGRRLEFL